MSFLKSCFQTLLKPAADPRQSAAYTDERQREMLVKVRRLLADIEKARQQLTEKTVMLAATMDTLEKQARTDLANGREDLGRRRLQQRQIAAIEQQTIQSQMSELDQETQRLLLVEQRMVTHIKTYVARREALLARYSSAESQVELNKALHKLFRDLVDLDQSIDLAETETDQMEARASLLDEDVENVLWLNPPAAVNLTAETGNHIGLNWIVEAELARLKEQVEDL
ncbi:MAG: hypothetical protein GY796_03740 [Chloroflexi bacterium]|nr:hypothetical protein [Chloroflexota bacterium]